MMIRIGILCFMVILTSCMGSGTQKLCGTPPPYTYKEKQLFKRLESEGYKDIFRQTPMPICETPKGSMYLLALRGIEDEISIREDSMSLVGRELSIELYKSVLEDSIIYFCNSVDIDFYLDGKMTSKQYRVFRFTYPKDSLEKWCSFKVEGVPYEKYYRMHVRGKG